MLPILAFISKSVLSQPRLHRPRVVLLARLALLPYAVSSLRLLRRRGSHEAGDVRQPAVAAARAAGLDGRRARVEADDARSAVGRHFPVHGGTSWCLESGLE